MRGLAERPFAHKHDLVCPLLLPFEPFAKIVVDDDVGVTHGSLLPRQAVGGGRLVLDRDVTGPSPMGSKRSIAHSDCRPVWADDGFERWFNGGRAEAVPTSSPLRRRSARVTPRDER